MAVDPSGFCLGDNGRLLEHVGNNQFMCILAFPAGFSSNSGV
jgi:hypothetical protein